MTPELINDEVRRTLKQCYVQPSVADDLCDLALDGLRFRKWVDGSNLTPTKLAMRLRHRVTFDEYRAALDGFIVERRA